jgi:phosphate transport system protein
VIEGHISRSFDGELAALHMRVVQMGALVLAQVHDSVEAYAEWRREAAQTVVGREEQVNQYDREAEEDAVRLIARRQPVASDLRAILAIDKATAELERAADEAVKLARLVLVDDERRGFRPGAATARDVARLGRLAAQLLRSALEAFDRMDAAAAQEVVRRDRDLDEEYVAGLRRLLTRAMEDPRAMQATVEAAFVLKSVERIGDHARNVARHALFLVGGEEEGRTLSPSSAAAR